MKKISAPVIKFSIAFAVMLVAYIPVFLWMWDRWFSADSYYSHGILVPFVTGFFIWQKRDELKQIRINVTSQQMMTGASLVVLGFVISLACSVLRIYFASAFSMFITLVGMILLFFGKDVLKALAFPVFFLVFMIPLPQVLIVGLSFRLKLFAAEIAKQILILMRIPAIRQGSIITMPNAQVVVDDVCSGLRSLISLSALASIFAYWIKGGMWKKILVFLSAIPIAVVTNVFRVIILATVSEIWGTKYTHGFLHDATGFMVFALAFILLFAVMKIFE